MTAAIHCPCCGEPMHGRVDPVRLVEYLSLSGTSRIIFRLLVKHFGQAVSVDDVVAAVYSGVRDGGPLDARGCVKQLTYQLRVKLRPYGLSLIGRGGRGRPGTYRLTWAIEERAAA